MPEGDIVRRTAATLDKALAGRVLTRADLRWPSAATVDLVGRTIRENAPYGKHLLTRLDDGRTLHTHLRMEGSWRIARTGSPAARARGPWVRAVLGGEVWTAIGERLGMLDVVATADEHTLVGHLGPDLLAEDFPTTGLAEGMRRWRERGAEPVCDVLLDQRVVAGMGTIFMAEPLFARHLWPWTPADEVPDPEGLLMLARGLMLRSAAAPLPTATGDGFRAASRVHGRAGRPCVRCGTPVARGQARTPPMERPVFWCPRCQHT